LAEQRVLARELPNGRIELVENAAHAVFVDDPEQFERLVNRFLAMASD
jgi:pimeloyl-ACP methyl ester carboxylesterase